MTAGRLLLLSLMMLPAVRGAGAQVRHLRVHETSFGRRHSGIIPQTFSVSSTGRIAYVVRVPGGEVVVLDGVVGKTYASIPRSRLTEAGLTLPLVFSPDGNRLAYVAMRRKQARVVVDGQEGPLFDWIPVGAPAFSSDGRHVAYLGQRGTQWIAVTDGAESEPYDQINVRAPEFTPDGHVVFTARRGAQSILVRDGQAVIAADFVGDPVFSAAGDRMAFMVMRNDVWSVIYDGIEDPPYAHLGNNLVFSRDGRRFLYQSRDTLDFLVVDRVPQAGLGPIRENSYTFSPDGRHVAFVVQSARRGFWVLDGQPEAAYDWVSSTPTFNADGRLAYVAERDGKRLVVNAGDEGETFDDISAFPEFREDRRRMLYIGKRGNRQVLVSDGVATEFDQIQQAFFAPVSGRLVVVARRGAGWRAIVEGDTGRVFPEPVGPFAESRDGRHLAYAASRGAKRVVVADGVEGVPYDDIGDLAYSADGHLSYSAKQLGKYRIIVDGAESPAYDDLISPLGERESGVLRFTARRGATDLRVELELAQLPAP